MRRKGSPRGPPKRRKRPPAPIMKLARPGMVELIERLQNMESNNAKQDLLKKAKAWPRFVAGRPKEEIKQVRQQAGEIFDEFNQRWGDEDGKGPIRTQ